MTLWPQACPMPGSASYSQQHRDLGPVAARPCLERRGDAVRVTGRREPGVVDDRREQIVGEDLLEVQLGVGVDLVARVEQPIGEAVDLGDTHARSFRASMSAIVTVAQCVSTILPSCSPLASRSSALSYWASGVRRVDVTATPSSISRVTSANSS